MYVNSLSNNTKNVNTLTYELIVDLSFSKVINRQFNKYTFGKIDFIKLRCQTFS
jgi:hypothetical protein